MKKGIICDEITEKDNLGNSDYSRCSYRDNFNLSISHSVYEFCQIEVTLNIHINLQNGKMSFVTLFHSKKALVGVFFKSPQWISAKNDKNPL